MIKKMGQKEPDVIAKHRITVIDALRGFALLGVILTHMLQHYGIFSGMPATEALFPKSDAFIQWLLQNVIMGKFINIFAFLFGLSFFIQMDRAAKKGIDFRKRFLWRMLILFVIGIIGNCFYTGDILSIYAVFGVLMVLMYRFKTWVLLSFVGLLLIGSPRIISTSYQQMTEVAQTVPTNQNNANRPPAPNQNIEKPSFINSAKNNLTRGLQGKLNYQFGMFGRGYITLALFILGLVVGRLRFFENVSTQKRRNTMLLGAFVLGAIAVNLMMTILPEPPSTREIFMGITKATPSVFVNMALRDIYSVLFSCSLVMAFVLLYLTKSGERYLNVLTPYGRMGLSNYTMQNIIGCFLFSAWAFGATFGSWGATEVFVLGITVYALQVLISKYWLSYYLYGPLEWFWRVATYLKLQPMKKL